MSGSHYAPDPWRYGLEDTIYEMTPVTSVTSPPPAEATQYDLRTVTEREADELAGLGMRLDNAVAAVNVTALRVSRLEELVAVQRAAIERLADALTVIQLREGL